MNNLDMLAVSLYAVVLVTLITNIFNIFLESRTLRKAGKTPLVGKNLVTVVLAAIGEAIVVAAFMWVYYTVDLRLEGLLSAVLFILPLYARNIGSYLAAWATWSVFVNLERRKRVRAIKKDQEEAKK